MKNVADLRSFGLFCGQAFTKCRDTGMRCCIIKSQLFGEVELTRHNRCSCLKCLLISCLIVERSREKRFVCAGLVFKYVLWTIRSLSDMKNRGMETGCLMYDPCYVMCLSHIFWYRGMSLDIKLATTLNRHFWNA